MSFLHSNIMGQSEIGFNIDLDEKDPWWKTLVVILVAVVAAIAVLASFGLLAPVFVAVWTVIKTVFSVMSALGITQLLKLGGIWLAADAVLSSGYEDNMFLPLFSYSPEEIFSGQILLFDVDFFNPQQKIYALVQTTEQSDTVSHNGTSMTVEEGDTQVVGEESVLVTGNDNFENYLAEGGTTGEGNEVTTTKRNVQYYYYLKDPNAPDEESNRVVTSKQNMALQLQPLISQWYTAIRNIAIVLSMSVLLYVGIRMLLASVAQEKAKYRQMLLDWIVGVCLLFFMHYIMAFSVSIVKVFNEMLSSTVTIGSITTPTGEEIELEPEQQEAFQAYMKQHSANRMVIMENDEKERISKKLEDLGMESFINTDTDPDQIMWLTNLMGVVRIRTQVSHGESTFIGYGIAYVVLVLFTLYFSWVYLKRVLYMAFLTLIAPLVALTYPIDKISDGQAQGFNKWLKEYIFNLLLQPLHLLLYTILVTSAIELATTNILYTLVAIGFLIPAEKILRNFFGFEKASTPPSAAGIVAGATVLNQGLNALMHRKPAGNKRIGSGSSGSSGGANGENSMSASKIRNAFNTQETATNQLNAQEEKKMQDSINKDPVKQQKIEAADEKLAEGLIDKKQYYDQRLADGTITKAKYDAAMNPNPTTDTNASLPFSQYKDFKADSTFKGMLKKPKRPKLTLKQRRAEDRKKLKLGMARAGRKFKSKALPALKTGGIKAARMASSAIAGAAIGIPAAVIGGSIGIATGDPSNVFQWGLMAGSAGAGLGASTVGDYTPKQKTDEQIAEETAREKAKWGDQYEKRQAIKAMRDWKKNEKYRTELESMLSVEEVSKMYKDGTVENYLMNGISSTKDIATMQKLQAGGKVSFEDAALAYEINDTYGSVDKLKPKDFDDMIVGGYEKDFIQRTGNVEASKKKAIEVGELAKQFAKTKKRL